MNVANPKNEWEQGMLDAYNTVVLDPIIEQVARELGASVGHAKPILEQYRAICSQTEQSPEKPHEQSNPKDI